LCSMCPEPCASVPAASVLSTVPVACSATTPPPTSGLSSRAPPLIAVSRKYPNRVGDSEAGPHFAYDGNRGVFIFAEADPQVRKEHDDKCLRS
jgi:hypothetical protein